PPAAATARLAAAAAVASWYTTTKRCSLVVAALAGATPPRVVPAMSPVTARARSAVILIRSSVRGCQWAEANDWSVRQRSAFGLLRRVTGRNVPFDRFGAGHVPKRRPQQLDALAVRALEVEAAVGTAIGADVADA